MSTCAPLIIAYHKFSSGFMSVCAHKMYLFMLQMLLSQTKEEKLASWMDGWDGGNFFLLSSVLRSGMCFSQLGLSVSFWQENTRTKNRMSRGGKLMQQSFFFVLPFYSSRTSQLTHVPLEGFLCLCLFMNTD